MLRFVLIAILLILIARAFWRVIDGIMYGLGGRRPQRGPRESSRSVQMVRDPVCGTYVVPDHALVLSRGSHQLFFCSADCRDRYQARSSTGTA